MTLKLLWFLFTVSHFHFSCFLPGKSQEDSAGIREFSRKTGDCLLRPIYNRKISTEPVTEK